MSYTTEQLISYLEEYESKCMDYQKQLIQQRDKQLGKHQRRNEEVFDYFGKQTVKTTESYWEVREQVQQYQRDYNVSGVAWEEVFYRGMSIRVPRVHDQLICMPGDKNVLIAATPAQNLLKFVRPSNEAYLSESGDLVKRPDKFK